ncbi:MAG: chromosomal replication initiator protein DnaA [Verrucomicrobiae bacterium]|nr:chromosomal replication initiator protein DnaA [Verrucomicrobiae bacterium]
MQISAEKIWNTAQEHLRVKLSRDTFNMWFAPLRPCMVDSQHLTMEVPNEFCEVWLKDNYLSLLQDAVAVAAGSRLQIKFRVPEVTPAPPVASTTAPGAAGPILPALAALHPATAISPRTKPSESSAERNNGHGEVPFNPKNTFDSFVVGTNNNFSFAAAKAVAEAPGKSYNPLFLYGGVGLGKTHLLHAIGQHVTGSRKGARVAYVSSEKFTNEYIDAIQNNKLVTFRKKYRQTDVLLIDDIQFLAGKERIQEEFFHTFNALHESHKQIVLTCDRPASEIQGLESRLVSRFEWGLVTDLQPPDIEMRLAILKKKAQVMNVTLPEDIINFLATRIRTNIRRLEGALIRVASYASLTGKKLTIEVVENLLREILHEEGRQTISIEVIQKRVAEHFDIRLADMTSKRRPENIAFPRQIAMYLSRQMTESSLNTIGEAFGGRDHGTVLHACRLVKDRMEVDSNVRQVVHYLEKQLIR